MVRGTERLLTYPAFLDRLFSIRAAGMRLGLDRMRALLHALDHDSPRFRATVLVAGTNGKGSTSAFVESMLRHAGVRTGLFTSPHLSRLAERFAVDGEAITDDDVLAAGNQVEVAAARCDLAEPPTFFERVAAMSLVAFADAGVEVAILEVGLGGRFDATNAVQADVAAVTSIALDHQQFLGDDIQSIATEKAGIFARGQRVVFNATDELALPVLEAAAARARVAAVTRIDAAAIAGVPGDWSLGLAGPHQRDNAACALAVIDHLEALGRVTVDPCARARGLASTRLPGRFETLQAEPLIIADGAHNPHAARALAAALSAIGLDRRVVVFGVSAGKDAAAMIEALAPGATAIVATSSRLDRARPAHEVAELAERVVPDVPVWVEPTVRAAIGRARTLAAATDAIIISGSLFVVGEARELVLGVEPDPVFVTDPLVVATPGP